MLHGENSGWNLIGTNYENHIYDEHGLSRSKFEPFDLLAFKIMLRNVWIFSCLKEKKIPVSQGITQ